MPTASPRRLYVPEYADVARTFLDELRQIHRDLLNHIVRLETLSQRGEPDRAMLTNLRWKLSQASLTRRLLTVRICDYFEPRCEGAQVEELRSLRAADREMLRMSAGHLSKWTADTILSDWSGYCRDGRAIRRRAHDHIALEQRVLYPMLEQAARLAA